MRPRNAVIFAFLAFAVVLARIPLSAALGGTSVDVCTVAAECSAGEPGGLGGEFDLPGGVAVSPAGNVYVADTQNNRIQEFDSNGNFIRAWGRGVVSGGGAGFEICEAAAECKAGEVGGLGGELHEPGGVAIDASENVYVADRQNNRIQVYEPTGGFLEAWGKDVFSGGETGFEVCFVAAECKEGVPGGLGGELSAPGGIAAGAGETVYVADTGNNRVQAFGLNGAFGRAWGKNVAGGGVFGVCEAAPECATGTQGTLGGELNEPSGIAVGAAETVYVADTQNDRIQAYEPTGEFLVTWGKDVIAGGGTGFELCEAAPECKEGEPGGQAGELSEPTGLGVDSEGGVYVADTQNNRGQVFTGLGAFVAAAGKDVINGGGTAFEVCEPPAECKAGETGGLGGDLDSPRGLATDSSGRRLCRRHREQPDSESGLPDRHLPARLGRERRKRTGTLPASVHLLGAAQCRTRPPAAAPLRQDRQCAAGQGHRPDQEEGLARVSTSRRRRADPGRFDPRHDPRPGPSHLGQDSRRSRADGRFLQRRLPRPAASLRQAGHRAEAR